MCLIGKIRAILGSKKEGDRVPSKSRMRNSRKIAAYADISRFAFFQCSRNCSVDQLVCAIQIIHHCLSRHKHQPLKRSQKAYCLLFIFLFRLMKLEQQKVIHGPKIPEFLLCLVKTRASMFSYRNRFTETLTWKRKRNPFLT